MICRKCNGEYADFAKFCPHCGAVNEIATVEVGDVNQNAQSADAAYQQPQYQPYTYVQQPAAVPDNAVQNNPYDVPSVLLNIICFFKPFIGLVLYLSWQMEYPKRAKGVGLAALIGVVLRFFGILAFVLLGATIFAPYIVELIEEIMWYF